MVQISNNSTKQHQTRVVSPAEADDSQYSLLKIMTIWAVVSMPMPILMFGIAPMLVARFDILPGLLMWYVGIAGMVWQFLVSVYLLRQELDEFTWPAIKTRIWLNKPTNPKTGQYSYKMFWWLIPAFAFVLFFEMSPAGDMLDQVVLSVFPSLANLGIHLDSLFVPELVGAWWLLWVAVLNNIFNYFLGEELLFRGVLLPKMRGAFGKWDWVANAVLFAVGHLDRPHEMIKIAVSSLAYTWTSKRFQSIWFAIILHGVEGIIVFGGVYMVASGLGL